MSTHDTANGSLAAAESETTDPLGAIVAELEDLLAPLTAERQQLEARLKDVDLRAVRIKEGIAALSPPAKRHPPQSPNAGKPKVGRSSHDWVPSTKTLDDIYAILVRSKEPMGVTAISNITKTSRGTVTKAIEELRRQERVRFAGNGGTGNANLYAPMERD